MQRILLLDNFDSFTYNLVHYLTNLDCKVDVVRNNVGIPDYSRYDKIVLSPGPGLPIDAGVMMELIRSVSGRIPILGVCLGMQAIAVHLGGEIYNQEKVKHGVQETIHLKDSILYNGLSKNIPVGLYHSWAVMPHVNYQVTSETQKGIVMSLENQLMKLYGVQFHPESIMTPDGELILRNFLKLS